ncbi:MAG: universal stress protein [Haloferacaceae archaeon]
MGILAAVGDDANFETVLTVAERLAAGLDQDLYVTHVTEERNASGSEREFRDQIQAFLSDADPRVEVDLQYVDRGGIRSGTAVGRQLLELTEDVDVDHVVIGHNSKDRLTAVREGHTDVTVTEEATVPVTVVPENAGS